MTELLLILCIMAALAAYDIIKGTIGELICTVVRDRMVARATLQMQTVLDLQKEVLEGNMDIEEMQARAQEIDVQINYQPELEECEEEDEEPVNPNTPLKRSPSLH